MANIAGGAAEVAQVVDMAEEMLEAPEMAGAGKVAVITEVAGLVILVDCHIFSRLSPMPKPRGGGHGMQRCNF
eukprot:8536282-Karenia_brevis.AAC.1